MIKSLNELIGAAKAQSKMRLAVAAAEDADVLSAVVKAAEQGIVEPVLVGDSQAIGQLASELGLDISAYELIASQSLEESAKLAVSLVSAGKADFLMKGLIDTAILLKAVLDKEIGLRTESQLSHVMVYEVPNYHKLIYLTDGGMNIEPDLEAKAKILGNAVLVAKALGNQEVKVACIAAKEKVNPKMPVTVEARALQERGEKGEFGPGVIVEGPLAVDLAFSKEAAQIKKFESRIAGDTDIVLVPNIEVGNGIGKSLTYLAGASSAGIIMGAKAPVVLVSRADDYETKLNSIALGSVIAASLK
ncbi:MULTISPECIES: bifunctional enoyl-CoA hydratase/phosphate acetyltransferase [unclassified Fusibacter]|uniref:bifunctional enoyl-CoA hydratase/phosphate acetyltransferase n=1 Tax=unclassified Fusibacter TaxID=2624464 RepID=UPI0010116907|nr:MULTISPECIES: bifunctional enoyl-CoA hydratase/phosphate acetyltransferase [unclassified Fusibacter]MCK8061176.1 bifunctional enoyl-CoA hydratase/phosphate acetyltransferase [Fusibacter sp. A2]NPE23287.1 bifunctional enoyl-CoA hydratase/phosphate acetyltransferase [Fusibacter sp. A1]RXV59329.1 phosphate butyryltransferase [Fusibacter sp. A1]